MDLKHINMYRGAEDCPARHSRYVWPATIHEDAIIIADSLFRKIRFLRRAVVHAIPGATVERLLGEITRGNIDVSYQKCVLIHVGTNNLGRESPTAICNRMAVLYDEIRNRNSSCTIIFSAIIIRPKDEDRNLYFMEQGEVSLIEKRLELNYLAATMLRLRGGQLLRTWNCLMKGKGPNHVPNLALYHTDGLHLNDLGVTRMTQYLVNCLGRVLSNA
jgi:hypothetical protein